MTTVDVLDQKLVQSVSAYSDIVRGPCRSHIPGICVLLAARVASAMRVLDDGGGCRASGARGSRRLSQVEAGQFLDAFMKNVPSAIRAEVVVRTRGEGSTGQLAGWLAGLPAEIERGSVPSQSAADA